MTPTFTTDWFTHNIPNWQRWLAPLAGRSVQALEIGCWEGRATLWLLENILTHDGASINVVDTFKGGEEHTAPAVTGIQQRFRDNTRGYRSKVGEWQFDSADALRMMHANNTRFDFIYIDGSHKACHVLTDAVLSWPLLEPGGIMIFDDYRWKRIAGEHNRPKVAIDSFLACYAEQFELLHAGHQVAIRRNP